MQPIVPAPHTGGFAVKFPMKVLALLIGLLLVGAGVSFALSGRYSRHKQAGYAHTDSQQFAVDDPAENGAGRRRGARNKIGPASEEWLTRFELTERSGKLVSSEDLKGQAYVVGFFFTLCPSICLNQNAKVEELQQRYRGQPIRFLSISCDPEVDRPEVLAEYAKRFHADQDQWLFLTGDMGYITRVAGELYFLAAERRFHAEKFVLVDADGKNFGFYSWSDPVQFKALQHDIDKLLAAGGKMEGDN